MKVLLSISLVWLMLARSQAAETSGIESPEELKILTLNAWLFPTKPIDTQHFPSAFSVDNTARRAYIAEHVRELDADVVTLQEVWGSDHRRVLSGLMRARGYNCVTSTRWPWPMFAVGGAAIPAAAWGIYRGVDAGLSRLESGEGKVAGCAAGLRKLTHTRLARIAAPITGGGVVAVGAAAEYIEQELGDGLMICSKFPFEIGPVSLTYRRTAYSTEDELLAAKGALWARIRHPKFGAVDVVTTHAEARSYDDEKGEFEPSHDGVNADQIRQLSQWLKQVEAQYPTPGERPVQILAGDLNFTFEEIHDGKWSGKKAEPYVLLTEGPERWQDSYRVLHESRDPKGYTVGSSNRYEGPKRKANEPDEIIDYVFLRLAPTVQIEESKVVFEKPPTLETMQRLGFDHAPLQGSDHSGVMTKLRKVRP